MNQNPYESPVLADEYHRGHWRMLALRLFAIGCWLMSLLFAAGFLTIANRPEISELMSENPFLFSMLLISVFALPAIGLATLGIASWRRVRRLGFVGFAGLVPLIVLILFALLRSG